MASLYKQSTTKIDKQSGEKIRVKSKKWYGQYRDEKGRVKRVSLCRDKSAAQSKLNDQVRSVERRQAGLIDKYDEHLKNDIASHIEDFKQSLLEKNNSPKHVNQTCNRLSLIVEECGFTTLVDMTGEAVSRWLMEKRQAKDFGIKTSNYYLSVVRQFGNWLVHLKRLPENPFQYLKLLNSAVDNKRERITLSQREYQCLQEAVLTQKAFRGLSGMDRAILYQVAVNTGFRASELASLKVHSLNLSVQNPSIKVDAAYSKRRREDVQPIRKDLAEVLKNWLHSKGKQLSRDTDLWPGTWHLRAAKMLKNDLKAADIPYEDEAGRVFDFHALRHQFISNLAESGIHPKIAQQLARHSIITLTMDRYTHSQDQKILDALDQMPSVSGNDEAEKFTLLFTQEIGFCCPETSLPVSEPDEQPVKEETPKPVNVEDLGVVCLHVSLDDTSSGGGIRTPDTRIMIPLL